MKLFLVLSGLFILSACDGSKTDVTAPLYSGNTPSPAPAAKEEVVDHNINLHADHANPIIREMDSYSFYSRQVEKAGKTQMNYDFSLSLNNEYYSYTVVVNKTTASLKDQIFELKTDAPIPPVSMQLKCLNDFCNKLEIAVKGSDDVYEGHEFLFQYHAISEIKNVTKGFYGVSKEYLKEVKEHLFDHMFAPKALVVFQRIVGTHFRSAYVELSTFNPNENKNYYLNSKIYTTNNHFTKDSAGLGYTGGDEPFFFYKKSLLQIDSSMRFSHNKGQLTLRLNDNIHKETAGNIEFELTHPELANKEFNQYMF